MPKSNYFYHSRSWARRRVAFTLIEMLVTTTVTLLVLVSLVQAFQWIGTRVGLSRAVMEMSGAMRGVGWQLQQDLDRVTVPLRPWPSTESSVGYFEYVEGPMSDSSHTNLVNLPTNPSVAAPTLNDTTILGDNDDYLAMTVHSVGEPFTGRLNEPFQDANGNGKWDSGESFTDLNNNGYYDFTTTSYDAEVIWWVQFDDLNGNTIIDDGELVLRRRVLLIRPDIIFPTSISYADFFQNYDISAHPDTLPDSGEIPTAMIANSLTTLSQRENRFAHDPRVIAANSPIQKTFFPYEIQPESLYALALVDASGNPTGEDIMLSHMKAFDVRAYDQTAKIMQPASGNLNRVLAPGDAGWRSTLTTVGLGAFVDLCYDTNGGSLFATVANSSINKSNNNNSVPWLNSTYDTWSCYYEHDSRDQDGDGIIDNATNGLDDDNKNGVDDVLERETSPPYPYPLRGLRVRIRMYEPDTRQVRQITVTSDFTPE